MHWLGRGGLHLLLILAGLSMVMPFLWMVSTSFRSTMEITRDPHRFVPEIFSADYGEPGSSSEGETRSLGGLVANYVEAWQSAPFGRYFFNTVFVALTCVLGVVVTSALAAYAFARMRFKGRDALFLLFLSMMMVPEPVYLVPSFIIIARLGWLDTYYALIVPWTVKVFSIFLLRQHFKTIPNDLYDAAIIDGCSRFAFLWRIILPLSKAMLVAVVIFTVVGTWNSFLWPLVMTNGPEVRPLQVGLARFSQEQGTNHELMMAAAAFSIAPLIVAYFFAQKQIIQSLATSGMKS